jgi:hypothetical protein
MKQLLHIIWTDDGNQIDGRYRRKGTTKMQNLHDAKVPTPTRTWPSRELYSESNNDLGSL